jgi:hypothetical protein
MEPELKMLISREVYRENLELLEIALDVDKIKQGLNRVRNA